MPGITRRQFHAAAGAAALAATGLSFGQPPRRKPVRVLLITGQNNHDWQRTTPLIERILNDADRFAVTVSQTPSGGPSDTAWEQWRPDLRKYDLVFSDYNGALWPPRFREQFEQFLSTGGAAVMLHAANNPFGGWEAFEQMVGLLWRGADAGARLYYDDDGKLQRLPPGEGPGAGHGRVHDWPIEAREPHHPIFKDLPPIWLHAHDELYHAQRGPAENMRVLATAHSTRESGGTGQHELVVWWVPVNKGRVLTFLPGHLWPGQESDAAFRCVGFRTLLQRCCEWAATDDVTIPVPDNFPTATQTSVRDV